MQLLASNWQAVQVEKTVEIPQIEYVATQIETKCVKFWGFGVLGFCDVILCVFPLRSLGAKLDQHCPSDLVRASMLQDTQNTKNLGTATTRTKVLVANELDSIYQLSFLVGATELLEY